MKKTAFTRILTTIVVLLIVTFSAHPARADDTDTLKSIIGVDMQKLQSCKTSADCALVKDFRDCCKWLGVNANDREQVLAHHSELFQSLATPETQHRCSLLECEMPSSNSAICEQGQCVAKNITAP